jgi:hypothetical protein
MAGHLAGLFTFNVDWDWPGRGSNPDDPSVSEF